MSKDMKLIIERFEKAMSEQMGAPILGMTLVLQLQLAKRNKLKRK